MSGTAGVPRLYGFGLVEGLPAMLLEWVEGLPLAEAIPYVSVDDEGRLSPFVAAAIGSSLFGILSRFASLRNSFVHGDISAQNVMISTKSHSLDYQVKMGVFDVYLLDYGCACSFDQSSLSGPAKTDIPTAAKVVMGLLRGKPSDTTIHETTEDIWAIVMREPVVANAVKALKQAGTPIKATVLQAALKTIDWRLKEYLEVCASSDIYQRPTAFEIQTFLRHFCDSYYEKLQCAYRNELQNDQRRSL